MYTPETCPTHQVRPHTPYEIDNTWFCDTCGHSEPAEGGARCPDCDLPLPESIEWSEGTSVFLFEDRRRRCLCRRQ